MNYASYERYEKISGSNHHWYPYRRSLAGNRRLNDHCDGRSSRSLQC